MRNLKDVDQTLFSVVDVARLLGIHRSEIIRFANDGRLPSLRDKRGWRVFRPLDVSAFAALHRSGEHVRPVSCEANGNAKLTAEQVAAMRAMYANGEGTQSQLARMFGVHRQTAHDICHGRGWGGRKNKKYPRNRRQGRRAPR